MRGGQRRYFTYCLLKDSLRCSETGAAFFNDMMSKHAMHSGGEEQVLYAGEQRQYWKPGVRIKGELMVHMSCSIAAQGVYDFCLDTFVIICSGGYRFSR